MITGSAESLTVATIGAPHVMVPPVADTLVYIVTLVFAFRTDGTLLFASLACCGATPFGCTSQ